MVWSDYRRARPTSRHEFLKHVRLWMSCRIPMHIRVHRHQRAVALLLLQESLKQRVEVPRRQTAELAIA
jgi:hypothetical protein